ncbi:MAG: acyltransferase family protein [Herminiimonas sp.]|uniref:acyltransferase family protein n=1 Tax=Herminiimonas sp. TaxID=1926289 RepID=UPI002721A4E7|nr:acyltransferase family protein [Herminiimonas sp.]MDO9419022.1 acyltransferase family protein [Herminiimonas sp.]
MKQNFAWIDRLKGIGIVAVVLGHIYPPSISNLLFLWHMPLFFLISGFLFRIDADKRSYLAGKVVHLLVPYVAFLLLLNTFDIVFFVLSGDIHELARLTARMLLGGRYLTGWTGVFWFVTCLFLTQQFANWIFPRFKGKLLWLLVILMLCLAFATSSYLSAYKLPLNIDKVLFSIPLFFLGWKARSSNWTESKSIFLITAIAAVLGLLLVHFEMVDTIDMKRSFYGTEFLSVFFAVCIANSLMHICKMISEGGLVGRLLSNLGKASMAIMFLHQAINLGLQTLGYQSFSIRAIAALMIPYLFYCVCVRFRFTNAFFLGARSDFVSYFPRYGQSSTIKLD